jgi:hypothetical protein
MPDNDKSEGTKAGFVKDAEPVKPVATNQVAPPPPPEAPRPAPPVPPPEQPRDIRAEKLEDRIHRAERWMIWLTAAIAFFGLCSVVVAWLQWCAMQGQLAVMRTQLNLRQ